MYFNKNMKLSLLIFLFVLLGLASGCFAEQSDIVIYSENHRSSVLLEDESPSCLRLAVNDFIQDGYEATGCRFKVVKQPDGNLEAVIIPAVVDSSDILHSLEEAAAINLTCLRGKWETYQIIPVNKPLDGIKNALIVAGSDPRGAMYGIYELSERLFGTDPLKHWTDYKPDRKSEIVWDDGVVSEGPPAFKYRGVYVNDEDRLLGWRGEGPDDKIEPEIYAEIIETMCRLKGNFISPAMLGREPDKSTRELMHNRGLFCTGSHQETLLANPMNDWGQYCQRKWQKYVPYSFTSNPEKLEQYWVDSIAKNSEYRNIWPVGLRGAADVPFWQTDPTAPDEMPERAEVVSKAIESQVKLLRDNIGKDASPVTALNMRNEILELYETGKLDVPEDVILIWDDLARVGRIRRLPDEKQQARKGGNGIYYHLTASQTQLVQAVSPALIWEEIEKAVSASATEYIVYNVGDFREFLLSISASFDLAWHGKKLLDTSARQYMEKWAQFHFGENARKQVADIYTQLFELENRCRTISVVENIAPHVTTADLYSVWEGISAVDFYEMTKEPPLMQAYAATMDFSRPTKRYWPVTPGYLRQLKPLWDELYAQAIKTQQLIPVNRQQFFFDNVISQLQTARLVNAWALDVIEGFELCETGDFDSAAESFEKAAVNMDILIAEREKASHDKWESWFRGEYHHIWDKSLWTLKPAWKAKDARKLAGILKKASRSSSNFDSLVPQPNFFDVTATTGGTRKVYFSVDEQARNASKVFLTGLVLDNVKQAGARLSCTSKSYELPKTLGARKRFFSFEIEPATLAAGENKIEFAFADDAFGLSSDYSIAHLRVSIIH